MASSTTIRPAVAGEAGLLSELGIRSKAVWGYSPEAMLTFREELTVSEDQVAGGQVFVMTVGDAVVGYYTLAPISRDVIELQHLFVASDQLRCGYGSRLLDHAIAQARAEGYGQLDIQSDPNASGFYLRHGIRLVRQIPSSIPGRTIPYFELPLASDRGSE